MFFSTLIEYLNYLRIIFKIFRKRRISLTFIKFFLRYLSITLLEQHVNLLEMSTLKEKIVAIILLRFSINFKNLEIFFNLIE